MGVSQLPSGSWRARVQLDGQRFARTFPTKAEALRWEADLREGHRPDRQTVGEYLTSWLGTIEGRRAHNTVTQYRQAVARASAVLGGIELQQLTPSDVQRWIDSMPDLSPKTVALYRAALGVAMNHAVDLGLISKNPAGRGVKVPPQSSDPRPTWTAAEVRTFLDALGEPLLEQELHALVTLMVTTGLRRGEALGLRWSDLDGATATISRQVKVENGALVVGALKTKRSRRRISVPASTIEVLHQWRATIEQLGSSVWVFPKPESLSEPVHPARMGKLFAATRDALDVSSITMHDLRHTFATMALLGGTPAVVVAEQLGHASVSITLDTYSHVLPSMTGEAVEGVAGHISGHGRDQTQQQQGLEAG